MTDQLTWSKSSYSDSEGGNCVEVAPTPTVIHIRDSKNPTGPEILLPAATWTAFISALQPGA
ncbi:DUF397 domain-containing protein [Streptomyces sp. NPDC049915]|uniref:DUF397 domain-containing protein n=1 Tax=Streptomyces sp. NPDC049915 TaxID=3155510 RepID=UPI00344A6520